MVKGLRLGSGELPSLTASRTGKTHLPERDRYARYKHRQREGDDKRGARACEGQPASPEMSLARLVRRRNAGSRSGCNVHRKPPAECASGRSQSETCAGCMVSSTTPTRWRLSWASSTSLRNEVPNACSVRSASYLPR